MAVNLPLIPESRMAGERTRPVTRVPTHRAREGGRTHQATAHRLAAETDSTIPAITYPAAISRPRRVIILRELIPTQVDRNLH